MFKRLGMHRTMQPDVATWQLHLDRWLDRRFRLRNNRWGGLDHDRRNRPVNTVLTASREVILSQPESSE
jgi:hypothetical protein